jgi:hypothetical protein
MRRKHFAKLLTVVGAAIAAIALLAPAAQAKEPAPGFEAFAGCPSPEENPNVVLCANTVVDGGHFKMGSKTVPIKKPIPLTGGVVTPTGELVFNSKGGLKPVPQEVPGGLVGLTGLDWLVNILGAEALKVYAVTELAGAPGSLLAPTFFLPIKAHLVNPVLGNKCYVGSEEEPIELNLTVGTTSPPPPNVPITGKAPEEEEDERGVTLLKDGIFVDNEFAAPAAKGCRLELGLLNVPIDGLVNLQTGLPSPAGTNETVQNFDGEIALSETVYP